MNKSDSKQLSLATASNLKQPQDELDTSQVADYLQKHPDFFEQHLDLLENLNIPHPSGSAVSLISKQLEIFRKRHHELENQLNALIEIARDNDALFNRMHGLTLAMLDADSLENAIANLDRVLAECFKTDFVAVKIFQHNVDAPIAGLFVAPDDKTLHLFEKELHSNQARCGRPTLEQAQFLFNAAALEVQSCAIMPMQFSKLTGIIAIGSREKGRFHYSMGNLFLTQMSEIIGTRLLSLLQ